MNETDPTATQPPASEPRKLGRLLGDSFRMMHEGAPQYALVILVGIFPGYVLVAVASLLTGLDNREAIRAAMAAGQWGGPILLMGAGLFGKLISGIGFMALVFSIEANDRGETVGVGEAYLRTPPFLWPMVWTLAQWTAYIIIGLILLVVPGVILMFRYSLSYLCVLLEGYSGGAALSRSKLIVTTHMGKVVGNLIVAGSVVLLAVVVTAAMAGAALGLAKLLLPSSLALLGAQAQGFGIELLARVVGVWGIAFSILLYRDLAALHPEPAQ